MLQGLADNLDTQKEAVFGPELKLGGETGVLLVAGIELLQDLFELFGADELHEGLREYFLWGVAEMGDLRTDVGNRPVFGH